jgi:hypothetical protein
VSRTANGNGFDWAVTFTSHLDQWSPSKFTAAKGAVLEDDSSATLTVQTTAASGTYPVSYTPWVKGEYDITVSAGGIDIKGSPFALTVDDGAVHAGTSTSVGPGLSGGTAGVPFLLTIQAKDVRKMAQQTIKSEAYVVDAVDAVQAFRCSASGGSFRVTFRGDSVDVSALANADGVASKLEELASVSDVTVEFDNDQATVCTVNAPEIVRVTFNTGVGATVFGDIPAAQYQDINLSGGAATITTNAAGVFDEVTAGVAPFRRALQALTCTASAGSFQVQLPAPYSALTGSVDNGDTIAELQAALDSATGEAGAIAVMDESGSPAGSAGTALCTGQQVFLRFDALTGEIDTAAVVGDQQLNGVVSISSFGQRRASGVGIVRAFVCGRNHGTAAPRRHGAAGGGRARSLVHRRRYLGGADGAWSGHVRTGHQLRMDDRF